MEQLMACSQKWLETYDATQMVTNSGVLNATAQQQATYNQMVQTAGTQVELTSTNYWPYYQQVYYPYYPVYQTSPSRPIKLAMSEIERLRKAAKADEKLKAILQKFTAQIEITVDFE